MNQKSWPELIGSGNPENGNYAAGLADDVYPSTPIEYAADAAARYLSLVSAQSGAVNYTELAQRVIRAYNEAR